MHAHGSGNFVAHLHRLPHLLWVGCRSRPGLRVVSGADGAPIALGAERLAEQGAGAAMRPTAWAGW